MTGDEYTTVVNNEAKILVGIVVATILILIVGIWAVSRGSSTPNTEEENKIVEIDYSKGQKIGSDSAKIKLVEFADLQCPACASAQSSVKEIVARNASNPDFQFIYRHYPLPLHKHAKLAANFAEIAGTQGRFFDAVQWLYETQGQWESLGDPTDYFATKAADFGLDTQKVKDDLKGQIFSDRINDDVREGTVVGVNSTPTFFVNGKKLKFNSIAEIRSGIEAALEEAKNK